MSSVADKKEIAKRIKADKRSKNFITVPLERHDRTVEATARRFYGRYNITYQIEPGGPYIVSTASKAEIYAAIERKHKGGSD